MDRLKKFFYVNWLNIFLVIILATSSLFIYSTTNSIFDFYKLNNNVDGLISTNAIHCKITGNPNVDLSKFIKSEDAENINIFIESDTKALKAYEVILLNNPPFDELNGDIFSEQNYFSGDKTAIIGSEVHKLTDVENLIVNGEKYSVIGEFNNLTIKSQNHIVLFCNGKANSVTTEKIIILDGTKKNINNAFVSLKSIINHQGLSIEKIEVEKISLTKLISQSDSIFAIVIFAGILLFLVYLLLIVFWVHSKEQYIGVCNIIGMSNIKLKLFFQFTKLYLISYIISTFVSVNIYNSISYTFPVLLIIFIISMTIISMSLLVGLRYSNNKNIKSILENDYE